MERNTSYQLYAVVYIVVYTSLQFLFMLGIVDFCMSIVLYKLYNGEYTFGDMIGGRGRAYLYALYIGAGYGFIHWLFYARKEVAEQTKKIEHQDNHNS